MSITYRQKLVASKMVENGGNIGKAMVAAGYSPATAKTPQKLTKTKGWQELMEKALPDELLTRKHRQLLNKKEVVVAGRGKDRKAFPTKEIDASAVAKGLDLAYKIRNKYPFGKHEVEGNITVVKVVDYARNSKNKYDTKEANSNSGR